MSTYTLFLTSDGPAPSLEAVRDHFAGRPGWWVEGHRAQYEHEDTRVVFGFDLASGAGEVSPVFELHAAGPHIDGLEAEPEVRAFVERFGLEVEDAQPGVLAGPYSTEGFLRGWRAANVAACAEVLAAGEPPTLPAATLERAWRWNLERRAQERALVAAGRGLGVPVIDLAPFPDGAVRTYVLWNLPAAIIDDLLPVGIALPAVDLVIVTHAHREPWRALAWSTIAPLLPAATRGALSLDHHAIEDPGALADALAALPALEGWPPPRAGQVLTREVVEAARERAGRRRTEPPA